METELTLRQKEEKIIAYYTQKLGQEKILNDICFSVINFEFLEPASNIRRRPWLVVCVNAIVIRSRISTTSQQAREHNLYKYFRIQFKNYFEYDEDVLVDVYWKNKLAI